MSTPARSSTAAAAAAIGAGASSSSPAGAAADCRSMRIQVGPSDAPAGICRSAVAVGAAAGGAAVAAAAAAIIGGATALFLMPPAARLRRLDCRGGKTAYVGTCSNPPSSSSPSPAADTPPAGGARAGSYSDAAAAAAAAAVNERAAPLGGTTRSRSPCAARRKAEAEASKNVLPMKSSFTAHTSGTVRSAPTRPSAMPPLPTSTRRRRPLAPSTPARCCTVCVSRSPNTRGWACGSKLRGSAPVQNTTLSNGRRTRLPAAAVAVGDNSRTCRQLCGLLPSPLAALLSCSCVCSATPCTTVTEAWRLAMAASSSSTRSNVCSASDSFTKLAMPLMVCDADTSVMCTPPSAPPPPPPAARSSRVAHAAASSTHDTPATPPPTTTSCILSFPSPEWGLKVVSKKLIYRDLKMAQCRYIQYHAPIARFVG